MDGADAENIFYTESKVYKCSVIWRINNSFLFEYESHPAMMSPSFSATNKTSYPWSLKLLRTRATPESRKILQLTMLKDENKMGLSEVLLGTVKFTYCNVKNQFKFTDEKKFTITKREKSVDFDLYFLEPQTVEDEIEFHCEISFMVTKEIRTSIHNKHCCMSKNNIVEDFKKLFNNEDHSDVEIYIGERKLFAHKAILAVRSTMLEAMFAHPMKENLQNRIDITDIKEDVFEEVLRYIYTGTVNNLEILAFELYAAGDRYNIQGLKCLCENAICSSISIETVLNILCFTKTYNMKNAETQALNYLTKHGSEVINLPVWNDISSQPDVMKTIAEKLLKRASAQME